MKRTAAALLLGTTLAVSAIAATAVPAPAFAGAPASAPVVYGQPHIEAVLTDALAAQIRLGEMRLELDGRALELRAPQGTEGLAVQNLHYSAAQGRFAAEVVATGPAGAPAARLPVSGRAYGVVQVPMLVQRALPGEPIGPEDITWQEMRADQTGSDIVAGEAQLLGQVPRRVLAPGQPIRLRDLQSPRIIDKGAIVTITLVTGTMSLSAQGKALQDGGKGDVIRVVNTQSNRIVEATVAGINHVAVAKPGAALN
ncbi:flagellar basal body P-ring formation chaperone FlgA [Azospirillum sp. SYSU D00513]|uniref:flagellar basal body P-ring formation chaperone FlgA n=1 Tax=Azospirillum sp. SYSU D00513 TaxID=2812561 RepID=UPI001A97849B|nr:flagellar basal body P-ring formation chaperone FlgA [Azospirillum sp. SYSU D00513]